MLRRFIGLIAVFLERLAEYEAMMGYSETARTVYQTTRRHIGEVLSARHWAVKTSDLKHWINLVPFISHLHVTS
jgi:hypothetical protein